MRGGIERQDNSVRNAGRYIRDSCLWRNQSAREMLKVERVQRETGEGVVDDGAVSVVDSSCF